MRRFREQRREPAPSPGGLEARQHVAPGAVGALLGRGTVVLGNKLMGQPVFYLIVAVALCFCSCW